LEKDQEIQKIFEQLLNAVRGPLWQRLFEIDDES
jgi:hypothetical protein